MELTQGWCYWHVGLDYLRKVLSQCTANNAQHIQVVNSGDKNYPFLIIYYNPPNKPNTSAPKCLLCNDTGQHLVDCPLCDKSGGLS